VCPEGRESHAFLDASHSVEVAMYANILIAIDNSPIALLALREAVKLAGPGVAMRIMTVIENPSQAIPLDLDTLYDVTLIRRSMIKEGRALLERARENLLKEGINASTTLCDMTEVVDLNLPLTIVREAKAHRNDLIVIGSHGRSGFNRLIMGSVAESVMRLARCPVLLARAIDTSKPVFDELDFTRQLLRKLPINALPRRGIPRGITISAKIG
jgi:nucleotide-binding universal stress UspA family protein